VQLGTGVMQGVCRPSKSLRVANLSEAFDRLLLQVCVESSDFKTSTLLKVCRKECVQEFSSRT
jgi:hypothetical protein